MHIENNLDVNESRSKTILTAKQSDINHWNDLISSINLTNDSENKTHYIASLSKVLKEL
jgi:hypothetical protein